MDQSLSQLLRRAAALQREGRRVLGCLLVHARGSTPQAAGALMLVEDAAGTHGTIGGGCVEAELRRRAFAMLSDNQTGIMRFKLDHDYGWDDGLICGGTIEVAVGQLPPPEALESIVNAIEQRRATALELYVYVDDQPARYVLELPPRDRLYIAGAGHVGQALARLALRLDFEVTLFDDREDLLERFAPDGSRVIAGDIAANLRAADFDDRTFAVIVTRGHRHDEQALHAVVNRNAAYVGMIGSRRKVKLTFDDLIERGVPADALAKVHAPIGLDIGAITVEEIAISIAAQLVQVRRAGHKSLVRGPEPAATAVATTSSSAS